MSENSHEFDSVNLWDTETGKCLWQHTHKRVKWKWYGSLRVLPIFSTDGQYLAVFEPPDLITLVDTQQNHTLSSPFQVTPPVESVAVSMALHHQTFALTFVRDEIGFGPVDRLTRRSQELITVLSLCLPVRSRRYMDMIRSCFSSDGTVLFVAFAVPSEAQIAVSSYNVNSRDRICTIKVDTKGATNSCALLGTLRYQEEWWVVIQLTSQVQNRGRLGFLGLGELSSRHTLALASTHGTQVTALEKIGERAQCVINPQGKLNYIQQTGASLSVPSVMEWDSRSRKFLLRGVTDGTGLGTRGDYIGVAIRKNKLTWMTRDGKFSFCKVGEVDFAKELGAKSPQANFEQKSSFDL